MTSESHVMKTEIDVFNIEECLNPTQIQSYFATLVTQLESGTITSCTITGNTAAVQSIWH